MEQNFVVLIAIFLGGLSVVCEVLLIVGFLRVKQLREHPGVLILIECASKLLFDFHWLTAFPGVRSRLSLTMCKLIGAVIIGGALVCWFNVMFLCIEVYYKLKHPKRDQYKRVVCYHCVSGGGFVATVLVLMFGNQNGESGLNTCAIQAGTYYELVYSLIFCVIMAVSVVFLVLCYIQTKKNKSFSQTLKYHFYVVLGFTICCWPSVVLDGLSWNVFGEIEIGNQGWVVTVSDK